MAGYQEKHYEDVANIISFEMSIHPERLNRTPTLRGVAREFAGLFAADNPLPATLMGATLTLAMTRPQDTASRVASTVSNS